MEGFYFTKGGKRLARCILQIRRNELQWDFDTIQTNQDIVTQLYVVTR